MIETNIRIIEPGVDLCLSVRRAEVITQHTSPDLLQKACTALKNQLALAAVPGSKESELLVVTQQPIKEIVVQEDDWCAKVRDSSQTQLLKFENPEDRLPLAQLLERCLLIEIDRRTSLWRLNNSWRIWYEAQPFTIADDIAGYRRFEVSAIPIDNVGVGLVVDVSTAFFTTQTVADFFQEDLPELERKRRLKRFERLSLRQKGQKATLWYDSGNNNCNCYFEEFLVGVTCDTTGERRLAGRTYKSLLDYYHQKGNLSVRADDPVAKVSFQGIDHPQPVVANKLRLRVMNEVLPKKLKQVDKIEPAERCRYIEEFWTQLEEQPLGENLPKVESNFWQPSDEKVKRMKRPDLVFSKGKSISAPCNGKIQEHQDYYRQRLKLLNEVGCLKVPSTVTRTIHIRVPSKVGEEAAKQLGQDISALLSKWTDKPINPNVETYDCFNRAISNLRNKVQPGLVVFVFEDEEPASYFNISYELPEWRVKRITSDTLKELFLEFKSAQKEGESNNGKQPKGVRDWQSFIQMNALEVLQLIDCIPWGFATPLNYEAQLAIDVGWDKRHFALSLLISRSQQGNVPLQLNTVVDDKIDPKKETINPIILRDKIVELFQKGWRKKYQSLDSVLVLRDGRECGQELEAISAVKEEEPIQKLGVFSRQVRVDVVDVYKSSAKGIRLWDRSQQGQIRQILEGTALFLDKRTVIVANTGAPTLHQGTAEPIMLVAQGDDIDMVAVTEDVYAASHLNWSNPSVAQRLPLTLKRTDDELKNRAAQEIRLGLLRGRADKHQKPEKVGNL
jgi:hypothetical protein